VGCCAHGNELAVSIKCITFLNLTEKEMDFEEGRYSDVGALLFYSRCICEIRDHVIVFQYHTTLICFNFNFTSLHVFERPVPVGIGKTSTSRI
jgi:hypothetical protein